MAMFRKAIEEAEKAAQQVGQKIQDPATKDQARRLAGRARRGLTTIVERIDPGLLADVVIKATSIQEKANAALRTKRSPYRIGEVVISAAIPPQVSFAIVRIDDVEEEITGDIRESSELVQPVAGEESAVLALDGSAPPGDEVGDPAEERA